MRSDLGFNHIPAARVKGAWRFRVGVREPRGVWQCPRQEARLLGWGGVVEGEGMDVFLSLLEFELSGLGDQLAVGIRQREKLRRKPDFWLQ